MAMLDWLTERLGFRRDPLFPAMFRVRAASGAVVNQVQLLGTFAPTGARLKKTQVTASGLCMIDWPPDTERLHLQVRSGNELAQVEVDARRPDPELVIEVQLA